VNLLVIGLNHRTAPLQVRERFAAPEPAPLLRKLVACDEIHEAVLVSTCNRVEVVLATRRLEAARHRGRQLFRRDLGGDAPPPADLEDMLYEYQDAAAIRHVFRVTASLDSLVIGEPQITGQMKEAFRTAVDCGACGAILQRLFHRAFATAKRVRSETRVAERPVSVARVAVDLAEQIFEEFSGKAALLVGAGEMMELALTALRERGLHDVRIANRTRTRAQALADRLGGTAHGLDELEALIAGSDCVLTCVGGDEPVFGVGLFERALRRRQGPLLVIDLGVPRNVDPEVNGLDSVYLYDLDDLGEVAEQNAAERRRETLRAEAICAEEQQRFEGWLYALAAVPTIRDLRDRAEAIRDGELDKALGRLGLSEEQRRVVDALTRSIVNKLLHAPVSRLRQYAESEEGLAYLEAARVLFALGEASEEGAAAQDADPPPDPADDP
jgi:glutamyl-tRNA reductase